MKIKELLIEDSQLPNLYPQRTPGYWGTQIPARSPGYWGTYRPYTNFQSGNPAPTHTGDWGKEMWPGLTDPRESAMAKFNNFHQYYQGEPPFGRDAAHRMLPPEAFTPAEQHAVWGDIATQGAAAARVQGIGRPSGYAGSDQAKQDRQMAAASGDYYSLGFSSPAALNAWAASGQEHPHVVAMNFARSIRDPSQYGAPLAATPATPTASTPQTPAPTGNLVSGGALSPPAPAAPTAPSGLKAGGAIPNAVNAAAQTPTLSRDPNLNSAAPMNEAMTWQDYLALDESKRHRS